MMTVKEHRSALSDLLSTDGSVVKRTGIESPVPRDLEDHIAEHALQPIEQHQSSTTLSTLLGRILTGAYLKQQGSAQLMHLKASRDLMARFQLLMSL